MISLNIIAQECSAFQDLSSSQTTQINLIVNPLETALFYENLYQIDSLSMELKNAFASQGGIPDEVEMYYNLSLNTNWLSVSQVLGLSSNIISNNYEEYTNLWKLSKGMLPPNYEPNSVFLRVAAENAVGLLKIADNEIDLIKKDLYISWATRALDSLATMQLPSGAFPFPDLRMYDDPVFSPVIQNFLDNLGDDTINVVQNGWIVDDKGTGSFKYDAGVIANAYYEAYIYTGDDNYKNIAVSIGNYLIDLKYNLNYNYNTFASLGLTRAYQLTNDDTYLERAINTLRYSVYPGQIINGRWVDGHNANSRYHSLIIQNIVPAINAIPVDNIYKNSLDSMASNAVINMLDYTNNCGSATSYLWLLKAYRLSAAIFNPLKNPIAELIGRYTDLTVDDYRYLDIPTMGEYIELLNYVSEMNTNISELEVFIYPNPTTGKISIDCPNLEKAEIYNVNGKLIKSSNQKVIDLSEQAGGIYFVKVVTKENIEIIKLIIE